MSFPLYLMFCNINLCQLPEVDGGLALILVTTLGYIIHQLFRWLTFSYYFGGRKDIMAVFRQKLSERNVKISKDVNGQFLDALYCYYFCSNRNFDDKYRYINRKSTFAISVGVTTLAFFIGTAINLLLLLLKPNVGVTLTYLIFWYIFKEHYKTLEKSVGWNEKVTISLSYLNIERRDALQELLKKSVDEESEIESFSNKICKIIRGQILEVE